MTVDDAIALASTPTGGFAFKLGLERVSGPLASTGRAHGLSAALVLRQYFSAPRGSLSWQTMFILSVGYERY